MRPGLCLLALLAVSTGTFAFGRAKEQIVYRVRTIGIVCAGVCPHFELTVQRDGTVTERFLGVTDENTEEGTKRLRQFRLSKSQVTAFFAALAPLRPAGHRQFGKPCDADSSGDDIEHGLSEYEIRWQGGGSPSYLEACFRDEYVKAIASRALKGIGVDEYSGGRIPTKGQR